MIELLAEALGMPEHRLWGIIALVIFGPLALWSVLPPKSDDEEAAKVAIRILTLPLSLPLMILIGPYYDWIEYRAIRDLKT